MWRAGLLLAAALLSGCALAPVVPRFVVLYQQRTGGCRVQVLHDTRSGACFVGFACGRQAYVVVPAEAAVCIP